MPLSPCEFCAETQLVSAQLGPHYCSDIEELRNTLRGALWKAHGKPDAASDAGLGIAQWMKALDNEHWKKRVRTCEDIDGLRNFLAQRNMLAAVERSEIERGHLDSVLKALIAAASGTVPSWIVLASSWCCVLPFR